jgi:uncharacterized membrane protein required for colicin V production
MNFNLLDAILIAILILAGYLGYRAGPLKKGITLLATLAAVALGYRLMHPVGGALASIRFISPALCYVGTYVIVVAAVLTATFLIYRRFGKKSSAQKPGRIFAAFMGVIEAAILLSTLLLALKLLDVPGAHARSGSLLYRPMVNLAPWSFDALRSTLPEGEKVQDDFSGGQHAQP